MDTNELRDNDEIRMTNDEAQTKKGQITMHRDLLAGETMSLRLSDSRLSFCHSFVIQHSCIVIIMCPFVVSPLLPGPDGSGDGCTSGYGHRDVLGVFQRKFPQLHRDLLDAES